jgi:hypothetical protein
MEEFKRMILKVSDVESEVATIPSTNDHTDGSWLTTDIYEGELFLNLVDNILQTRTEAGIVTLYDGAGSSVNWGDILGTLSDQTDLQDALDEKINYSDFTTHSILVKQSGGSNPTSLSVGNNTLIGRKSGGGSNIEDLSVTEVKDLLGDDTLIETITVGTRALLLTDRNKNLENDGDCTITIPTNASVEFPIGTQIFFTKKAETLDFVASGGVTINSVDNLLEMGRINCGASLLKIGENEWNLIGELV